ncbi:STAS domain-containing protein [Marinospirillum perlucidum]|uniref:STAS domain-containing protein n=1 Tax=Marinospirillum perlucidum TaxID=1982602 RepID=UPI000DF43485|nr:STAS domain-containing protein [Marinospirillum perlucidum]
MSAQLVSRTSQTWSVTGEVDFDQAQEWVEGFQPQTGEEYRLELSKAKANAALLLVLLGWLRKARRTRAHLLLQQPEEALLRLISLSGLDAFFDLEE